MVGQGGGGYLFRSDERYSGNKSRFKIVSRSLAEEDAFDVRPLRKGVRSGVLFSIMNLAKGALGGGVLAGHVAYMTAGYLPAIILNMIYGVYMCYNFYILVMSAQRLCRRCHVASMTYPDVGEAAFALFPNPKVARWSTCYRKWIDVITCLNLFGSCAAYQLMVAKTIKQLAEDTQESILEGRNGLPSLRAYIAFMIVPFIIICLITEIKYLAPFSIVANIVIAIALIVTICYAAKYNPGFENMVATTSFLDVIKFTGMSVFSMSCAGVVIPVENNMSEPKKFPLVLGCGYIFIIGAVFCASFFGYAAFLDKCESPITMNFPLTMGPKVLKGFIAIMIYVTHAVNFFMPFNCVYFYLKPKFKPQNQFKMELFFRALIVIIISLVAIAFPSVDALMGFLGCFCLSNMAFICPNTIYVLVHYERPGKNKQFMIWRAVILSLFGVFILFCGSFVSGKDLVLTLFKKKPQDATTPGPENP
ncbi:proton-coupled amino acid transporter-like protein pathetic [Cydia pomonella]|uniref:proton-coupled amino acid transporter-like protein pathetic n=1 Tax=Cydia pomonella TaxID=82600 RepID=UPI002ADD3990|nr:proton-coupled amino acid transporter-like protein pathetic [Cydia pomonella]